MPIVIAPDNHVFCEGDRPLKKSELTAIKNGRCRWHTLAEWEESVVTGEYADHDCDGNYAYEVEGAKHINMNRLCYTSDLQNKENRIPKWATHVMWSSK